MVLVKLLRKIFSSFAYLLEQDQWTQFSYFLYVFLDAICVFVWVRYIIFCKKLTFTGNGREMRHKDLLPFFNIANIALIPLLKHLPLPEVLLLQLLSVPSEFLPNFPHFHLNITLSRPHRSLHSLPLNLTDQPPIKFHNFNLPHIALDTFVTIHTHQIEILCQNTSFFAVNPTD